MDTRLVHKFTLSATPWRFFPRPPRSAPAAVKPMAPNAARARKAARRAQEEAAAAEMAIHTTPSAAAAIKRAEQSEAAAAKDEERAEHDAHVSQVKGEAKREGVDLTAYCVVCGTRDATSVAQHVQSTRAGSSPSCGHPEALPLAQVGPPFAAWLPGRGCGSALAPPKFTHCTAYDPSVFGAHDAQAWPRRRPHAALPPVRPRRAGKGGQGRHGGCGAGWWYRSCRAGHVHQLRAASARRRVLALTA